MKPFFKDPFARVPIKIKLPFGLIMLFLFLMTVGGYFLINSVYTPMNHEILKRLQTETMSFSMLFDRKLASLGRRAADFSSDGFIRTQTQLLLVSESADRSELLQHLQVNKLSIVDEFVDLQIYDMAHSKILGANATAPVIQNDSADYFVPGEQRFSSIIAPDSLNAFPSTAIVSPLYDLAHDRQIGYLVCIMDLALVIESSTIGHGRSMPEPYTEKFLTVVDQRGLTLEIPWWYLESRKTSLQSGEERIGIKYFQGQPVRKSPGVERVMSQSGEDFFRESYLMETVNWRTTVELNTTEAMNPLQDLEGKFLGIASFIAIPILILLFFAIQYVIQPLGELQRMAIRIKEGDFSARNSISSEDEIGTLAKTSNLMAEAIEERTLSLERIAADLQKQERELRVHHDLLDTVIHSMTDGLVLLNFQGKVTLSNKAAGPLLDIIEATDGHLSINKCEYHKDDSAQCATCMSDPNRTTSCVLSVQETVYEILSTKVQMPHGSSKVLVARNITEREQMHRQQGHQERLTVLGKLAAVVAHELNNPLAAISMYNQMMESELSVPSPFDEHIDVIKRNTKSCQRIIHDLLDYARVPHPKIQETDLHKLLNDVVLFLRPLHGESRITIVRNFETDDPVCWGDTTQLQQVFVNLLVNAFQAVDAQSGTVRMYTRDVDEGRAIAVRIEDNGSGIEEAHRKDIFEPFFTTKSHGGTGLGLSTSVRIIEAHEGTLELLSSRRGQTVFQVILPHLRNHEIAPIVQIESDDTIGTTI